jgi:flagellar assembly factor FliW
MTVTDRLVFRSPRLGDVEYAPTDVVRFPSGLPGFEALREFLVVTRDECAPIVFLASLDDPGMTLPLLPAPLVMPEREPALAAVGAAALGAGALAWYVVLAIGHEAREITANLRAPVAVNLDTRVGRQIILPDETLPLAARLGA